MVEYCKYTFLHSSYISIEGLNWVRYLLSLNSIESCLPSIQVIRIFEMLTSVDISDHHYGKYVVSISTSTFSTITLNQESRTAKS